MILATCGWERLGWRTIVAILVAFGGLTLALDPGGSAFDPNAVQTFLYSRDVLRRLDADHAWIAHFQGFPRSRSSCTTFVSTTGIRTRPTTSPTNHLSK